MNGLKAVVWKGLKAAVLKVAVFELKAVKGMTVFELKDVKGMNKKLEVVVEINLYWQDMVQLYE